MSGAPHGRALRLGSCAFVAGLALLYVATGWIGPRVSSVTLVTEAGERREVLLPFRAPVEGTAIDVTIEVVLNPLHPALYHLELRGCLEGFSVNGKAVVAPGLPRCGASGPTRDRVDLSSHLRAGSNQLELRIHRDPIGPGWTIHTLDFGVSTRDPWVLAQTALLLFLLAGFTLFAAGHLPARARPFWFAFALGVAVRALYVIATGLSTRAYDWHGHLVYVSYVAEHLSLPPPQAGWQTYQPPLHYAIAGAWVRLGAWLGRPAALLFQDVQLFSALLSAGALGMGLGTGARLFPSRREARDGLLFALVLAVFPGLVFFASRISNDASYQFLAFAFLALLLRFWQEGRDRDWWALSAVIGLGLLTKSNALLLLPVAALCLLLREHVPLARKGRLLTGGLLVAALLAGWFHVLRFGFEGEQSIVGNIHRFDPELRIERSLARFLVFDPLAVLAQPFVDDRVATTRPGMFWEYLFRTAHFGGFRPEGSFARGLAVPLLATSMLLLPVMALGFLREARRPSPSFPLAVTSVVLLAGHLAYALRYPFSFNQDFRFSVLLVVPMTYYTIVGRRSLPSLLGHAATAALVAFCVLSTALVVALYLDA